MKNSPSHILHSSKHMHRCYAGPYQGRRGGRPLHHDRHATQHTIPEIVTGQSALCILFINIKSLLDLDFAMASATLNEGECGVSSVRDGKFRESGKGRRQICYACVARDLPVTTKWFGRG